MVNDLVLEADFVSIDAMCLSLDTILLAPKEMAAVDLAALNSGIDTFSLMLRAGCFVAAAALRHYPQAQRFVVICGPGNNGGDGYVCARRLVCAGCHVAVYHLGDPDKLKGDALQAYQQCPVLPRHILDLEVQNGDVVIDAIFGAGLGRAVPDEVVAAIEKVENSGVPLIAVDLPSGLCGRRGVPLGRAFTAARTVTFMTRKPGHLLMPGRALCGDIEVCDIGIPKRIVHAHAKTIAVNNPSLWRSALRTPDAATHKYRRGHLAVFSGHASNTGAARLSAHAGLASGAGLVTVASPCDAMAVNGAHLTAVMLREIDTAEALNAWISTARLDAFVLGPGFGIGERARSFVHTLKGHPVVLDADAITSFQGDRDSLFASCRAGEANVVLTPHGGEFARLFPEIAANEDLGKVEKAQAAAELANAVIVYKGADTVIADPRGRVAINDNAPSWLATAGSGDVLAGMIGALLANGMPAFEASAAAVYLHGSSAMRAGPAMTAEDLLHHIDPQVIA